MTENEQFMAALALGMPKDERMILCGFVGDPNTVGTAAWKPHPWRPENEFPFDPQANIYTTVSSFRKASDGSWRRRGECFAAGRALMVDDVGTKLPSNVIDPLPPSALIETSPGNFQAWYFLAQPEQDRARFDAVIRAFIAQKLLGADPGMSGVTRVGRCPDGTNSKEKYGGAFRTKYAPKGWNLDTRYTVSELLTAFGLKLLGRQERPARLLPDDIKARAAIWCDVHEFLEQRDMFKRDAPDVSGWTEMQCPWVDGHTGRADTGAAIREPAEDNGYYGAFRCHHGSCADRGWKELTDWVNEIAVDQLNDVNAGEDV